jgi:hypothetical protein
VLPILAALIFLVVTTLDVPCCSYTFHLEGTGMWDLELVRPRVRFAVPRVYTCEKEFPIQSSLLIIVTECTIVCFWCIEFTVLETVPLICVLPGGMFSSSRSDACNCFDCTSSETDFLTTTVTIKLSLRLTKHCAMKTYWEWRCNSTHYLTSVLDGGEWSASYIPQGKSPRYPLDRRLGRPQTRSGHGVEEKNFQPPPRIEPRSSDGSARSQSVYRLSYSGSHFFPLWHQIWVLII